jgi:hypothetical protein
MLNHARKPRPPARGILGPVLMLTACLGTVAVLAGPLPGQLRIPDIANSLRQIQSEAAAQVQKTAQLDAEQERIRQETASKSAALATRQAEVAKQRDADQQATNALRDRIVEAAQNVKASADRPLASYRRTLVMVTLGAILLALGAGVAGLANLSKVAGLCSLVTTALLTVPKVFPLTERVDFYQYLSSQSYSLQVEASVPPQPAAEDVAQWQKRLDKILDILGNPPKEQDPESMTRLINVK